MKVSYFSKIIAINIIVLIALLLILEASAKLGRFILNKPQHPFFYEGTLTIDTEKEPNSPGHTCNKMKTHPIFGYVNDHEHKCKIRGGTIIDEFIAYSGKDGFKNVVTLGGSTTSGYNQARSDGYTWPYQLNQKLNEHDLRIFNGGVDGYTSSQELLKLAVEVRRLKNIKLIISFNGINELSSNLNQNIEKTYSRYPFYPEILHDMFLNQRWIDQRIRYRGFLPNLKTFAKFLARNLSDTNNFVVSDEKFNNEEDIYSKMDSAKLWFTNVNSMKGIAEAIGAQFYVFIQPTMGLNGIQSKLVSNDKGPDAEILSRILENRPYIRELNELYEAIKNYCTKLNFCIDLTYIAPPDGNNYYDPRHHNKNGNKIIAEEIYKYIKHSL